jgi:putative transposase
MWVTVTARVKAVTPEPSSHTKLVNFLKAYRDWTQYVIDEIWELDRIPSMRELHHRFYKVLRKQGFRAHHCHKIERRAREAVKAVKKNNGSKPVLRRLTARLDHEDYRLDPDNKILRMAVLNGEWVELRLRWYSYLDKYFNNKWRLREILVSYRNNTVWVYLTFEKDVKPREPRTIMGIDVNFNNIAYTIVDLNGKLVSMSIIPFNGLRRALSHRIIAEKIQRKYSKKWRNVKGIREAISRHGRRARSILVDSCHYISKRIVEIAKEYNALIVLEDLNKLKARTNGSRKFNKRLALWAYRRIQGYIHYKALIKGIRTLYVTPRNTSRTSPIRGRLEFINYRWVRLPNDVVTTRDIVASWNIALRGLNLLTRDVGLRGSVEALKAPNQMQSQEGMRGKPVQVLQITKIT